MFGGLTCLGLHREVGLPLQDAVHEFGTVPICGVICISGIDFYYKSTYKKERKKSFENGEESKWRCLIKSSSLLCWQSTV